MTIWAVTSYFNPKRFGKRYQNFRIFREALNLPLLTVEWAQADDFELTPADSDRLVSVSGGDLMWQKERLVNLAIAELPPDCDAVVWLDCDIVFEDDRWIAQLDESLAQASIVQLFSEVVHLDPNRRGNPLLVRESLMAALARNGTLDAGGPIRSGAFDPNDGTADGDLEACERRRLAKRSSSGHAWAAHRGLLEDHGLYDACICGAGDMAIALAAVGQQELFLDGFPLNRYQKAHYRAWADGFSAATEGTVGFIPSRIHHLFHGNLANRQYRTRLQWLTEADFDPAKDLVLDRRGLWHWKSDRRARESRMSAYFERRSEDAEAQWLA